MQKHTVIGVRLGIFWVGFRIGGERIPTPSVIGVCFTIAIGAKLYACYITPLVAVVSSFTVDTPNKWGDIITQHDRLSYRCLKGCLSVNVYDG